MVRSQGNIYTHFDIKVARKQGYGIHLLQDDGMNACIYKKRLFAYQVFGEYHDTIYKLKQKLPKNKLIKQLQNILWGALSEKATITHNLNKTLHMNRLKGVTLKFNHNQSRIICEYEKDVVFKMDYARVAPFITAYGRYHLYQVMQPFVDKVKRIHTDGIYCNEDVSNYLKIGKKMGEFKIEKQGNFHIKHVNCLKPII